MVTSYDLLPGGGFGSIPATDEHLLELGNLVHSHSRLQQAGYVLWPLSQADLNKKRRCGHCSKVIRKGHEKQKSRAQSVKLAPTMAQRIAAEAYARENRDEGQPSMPAHARSVSLQDNGADVSDMMRDLKITSKDGKDDKDTGPPMNCKFHPGRQWTCCGTNVSGPPCTAHQFHTERKYRRGELESNWQYLSTPHYPAASAASPPEHVAAVVIDCEMGTAASGESELIRVSAVDFFTRRVLVDSLVWPDVKMAHYNTRYSGVSRPSMEAARRARRTLAGRAGAREALWRFVGPQTVVVGHSANSDLNALRWIHPVIVDTLLLEMRIQPRLEPEPRPEQQTGAAAGEDGEDQQPPLVLKEVPKEDGPKEDKPKYPGLSLKALAAERLKRTIQIRNQGHDSLEDALATRDLLLWHMINKPEPPIIS